MSWNDLVAHLSEIEILDGVGATLGWDEQTYMPKKAAGLRGSQMALLSRLSHERRTDARIGRWLEALDDKDPVQRACARNLGRVYRREQRVPAALVDKLARARSEGFAAWIDAKAASDWQRFLPSLRTLRDLTLERVRAIDPKRHPYEVLLEEYDPGTTVESLRAMFARLRDGLVPLIDAIAKQKQLAAIDAVVPLEAQWKLSSAVAAALGFDFEGGRLDRAEHPFSTGQGEGDVRITAHLKPSDLLGGLGGTIHETGHALYEQGLPFSLAGTTVKEAASYGLHESQSRFWENYVGRSRPFAIFLARTAKDVLGSECPAALADPDAIFRAQNRVERSLIRTQADEVTYNLHVIVRFEIELAIFEGSLALEDVPAAWNEKYQSYLGVTPPDTARGALQDVHWSSGAFGYFPSYTLGNLYAASFGKTMETAIPSLWSDAEKGDFSRPLAWLREHVHARGHLLETPELVRDAVGERDHVEDLLGYLWTRVGSLYGVSR
ncbi:MAG: carboxypeptidase M32 [Deltaproteobacteria bacterium]|nr:carboxypeptidase M32 [Deltaproteobacteria bacterium]